MNAPRLVIILLVFLPNSKLKETMDKYQLVSVVPLMLIFSLDK